MKKKLFIISFSIILVIGLLIIITSKNKKVYTEIDGIRYAILVNGESATSFPSGNYNVDANCTNADAYWNSVTNKLIVKNIKGNITCDIAFNSITSSDYFNTYLTSLSGTTQGEGQLVSENGLRYEGKNPNNYVMFNNELWRILGVFSTEYDSNNDGTTDTTANLVKIIRDESIGGLIWNNTSANNWPNSSLYHLLNEQYYDWNTNKATIGTYCYGYSNVPSNCDYSIKGIQDGYRNMIVKAKWYLGGGGKEGYTTYTPDSIYSYERDANAIYSGGSASTPGYIGLMYGSDYLYGVLASDCDRTKTCNSYNTASCAGKNWLYGMEQWTITPNSAYSSSIMVSGYNGSLSSKQCSYMESIRPVLYLSSSVYRVGGSGTITDPYIIGMATS